MLTLVICGDEAARIEAVRTEPVAPPLPLALDDRVFDRGTMRVVIVADEIFLAAG